MDEQRVLSLQRHADLSMPVRFGDTDPYGVVYFASYFRYCHHGIEEFFRQAGFSPGELFRNQDEGFGLPIAGASCDFFKPVRYGEFLHLAVTVLHARTKSLTFQFSFYRQGSDELVARGEATLVCIDKAWKSRPLPERLRNALTSFPIGR